jgi:hypothetical protein
MNGAPHNDPPAVHGRFKIVVRDRISAALQAKLVEEAELADVLEVLQALAAAGGMRWDQLEAGGHGEVHATRGFDSRLVFESVQQAG